MADHTHPRQDYSLGFGAGSSFVRDLHRLPVTGHTGPLVRGLLDGHGRDTWSRRLGARGATDRRASICLLSGPAIKRLGAPACRQSPPATAFISIRCWLRLGPTLLTGRDEGVVD